MGYHGSAIRTGLNQQRIEARQSKVQPNALFPKRALAIRRYGLAVLAVSVAIGCGLLLGHYDFRNVADPLFLFAIAIVVWYAGLGPAILAVVLSGLANDYFFTDPIYSIYITRADVPHFVIFISFAGLITWFAVVRRRAESALRHTRDELEMELLERTQREHEVRALNEELGKRTVELESINKELEAFSYSVSHDLRAPLRHMVGFTELLQKNTASLDEKSRRYVKMILESGKKMGTLIDDLLAFSRIGRTEAHKTTLSLEQQLRADVRVIAATNRDLESAISSGAFRSDLFYRLNVFPVQIPPLRERREDIPTLIEYFVQRYSRKAGKRTLTIERRTLELLQSYAWPGNIRELQNVIERSVIVCETDLFSVDPSWLSYQSPTPQQAAGPIAHQKPTAQEKETIEMALAATGGRVAGPSGAAAQLGVPPSTLESRIRALKINKFRFKNG
jgi:signal transduction histidine kinase